MQGEASCKEIRNESCREMPQGIVRGELTAQDRSIRARRFDAVIALNRAWRFDKAVTSNRARRCLAQEVNPSRRGGGIVQGDSERIVRGELTAQDQSIRARRCLAQEVNPSRRGRGIVQGDSERIVQGDSERIVRGELTAQDQSIRARRFGTNRARRWLLRNPRPSTAFPEGAATE